MKKAFTLVELIVSVILLGLIMLFVTSALYDVKNNITLFEKVMKNNNQVGNTSDLLYQDILYANDITIKGNKHYSILKLQSTHSVYNIAKPYILWLVLKEDNRLIRIESAKPITLPIKEEDKQYIFVDKAIEKCNSFTVNLSKDNQHTLVYLHVKDNYPIVFEVLKP